MDDRVRSALATAVPDRPVETVRTPGGAWSDSSRTVQAVFADGGRAYLTVADPASVRRERAVLAYLGAGCAVTVPEVLAADAGPEPAFLLTAPLDGATVADSWQDLDRAGRSRVVRSVGRALATVHSHRFADHGWVRDGDTAGLCVDATPWPELLVEVVQRLWAGATTDRFDWYFEAVIDALGRNRGRLEGAPSALLHGDPAQPNCILTDNGVGLVDWEASLVGDPAWELSRARCQLAGMPTGSGPEWIATALHDGYRERAGSRPDGDKRGQLYRAVQFTLTAGHAEKTAAFLDTPDGEFLEWVRAEGRRRLPGGVDPRV